ncbi:beta/gamma crystallin family protein [Spirillospora sp. NBC_00431]
MSTTSRLTRLGAASAVLVATTSTVLTQGASASTLAAPSTGRNCVINLAAGGAVTCYETFTAAIAAATGGKITGAPRDAHSAASNPAFKRRIEAIAQAKGQSARQEAETVIGFEYQHSKFRGRVWTVRTSHGCDRDNGVEWEVKSLYDNWWNDRISSFETFANCQANHYENAGGRGVDHGYRNSTRHMGAMNDQTSSIRWR